MKWNDKNLTDSGLTEKGKEFWQIFKLVFQATILIGLALGAFFGLSLLITLLC